jgi:hypothetical protein
MTRLRTAVWWTAAPLVCLILYWPSLTTWFRGDDFAWLGVGYYDRTFHDLLVSIFAPQAQGTIRPLSERLFFMLGFRLFGMDALPFRIAVLATHFANLALVASIGARLMRSRAAGLCACLLWLVNSACVLPLSWTCVYNQILCGFFLLLAFHFLLRYTETGERRYYWWQWVAFVIGFGALEINVVYPAIAAAYTWMCARRFLRGTVPMFAVSALYAVVHRWAVPAGGPSDYAMHFTGAMFRTFFRYWMWTIGPVFQFSPLELPSWVLPFGIAVVSAGLLAFAAAKLKRGGPLAGFCFAWYVIVLAPVLPLRDHMTEYYVFLPEIGLAWLAGWALVESWRAAGAARLIAVSLAGIYIAMALPTTEAAVNWNRDVTTRVRAMVEGVEAAHSLHPRQSILLEGVDSDLFWNGVLDRPFRLFGLDHSYLAPGSEQRIDPHPDLGEPREYILPAGVVANALARDEIVVYDVRGPRLRNITSEYAARPRDTRPPLRVDAASPLTQYLLGSEWHASDGDHRWMPQRATLRIGAPDTPGRKLYLRGQCPDEQLKAGPLGVTVTVDGAALPPASIRPGENAFDLSFVLPPALVGKAEMQVTVEVSRVFRPASDPRDLGLAFGVFEVK